MNPNIDLRNQHILCEDINTLESIVSLIYEYHNPIQEYGWMLSYLCSNFNRCNCFILHVDGDGFLSSFRKVRSDVVITNGIHILRNIKIDKLKHNIVLL